MSVKQVIVIRTRYPDGKGGFFKPRTGKLIAQGAHASMKVFFDMLGEVGDGCYDLGPREGWDWWGAVKPWVTGIFKKVVVGCMSEADLLDLYQAAQVAGLPCALIEDAGLTEFHGVLTPTCIAIGPAKSEDIDAITGGLPLL